MKREIKTKVELYNDNFENFKRYNIPKAQLIIADIPYNIGNNFYASRSDWYVGGDSKNGESENANSMAFNRDENFNVINFMKFARKLLKKEPKEVGKAPAMKMYESLKELKLTVGDEDDTLVKAKLIVDYKLDGDAEDENTK